MPAKVGLTKKLSHERSHQDNSEQKNTTSRWVNDDGSETAKLIGSGAWFGSLVRTRRGRDWTTRQHYNMAVGESLYEPSVNTSQLASLSNLPYKAP